MKKLTTGLIASLLLATSLPQRRSVLVIVMVATTASFGRIAMSANMIVISIITGITATTLPGGCWVPAWRSAHWH